MPRREDRSITLRGSPVTTLSTEDVAGGAGYRIRVVLEAGIACHNRDHDVCVEDIFPRRVSSHMAACWDDGVGMKSPRDARARRRPDALSDRLQSSYARYGSSARKRRAWAATNPGNRAAQRELTSALRSIAREQLDGDGAILDVGCGTGGWVRALSESVASERIYGIDAVANRIEEARQATPGAHLSEGDARALPFRNGQFVLVLLFTILLDLPTRQDIAAVLAECQRVLAPGGLILIYEPRVPNPLNKNTRVVRRHDIDLPVQSRTLTLVPAVARRLGRSTSILYPILSAVPWLRTHRLWWYQKPVRSATG